MADLRRPVRTLTGYAIAVLVLCGGILFVASFVTGADPWQNIVRPVVAWCGNKIT